MEKIRIFVTMFYILLRKALPAKIYVLSPEDELSNKPKITTELTLSL